jgi:hypothetical protein
VTREVNDRPGFLYIITEVVDQRDRSYRCGGPAALPPLPVGVEPWRFGVGEVFEVTARQLSVSAEYVADGVELSLIERLVRSHIRAIFFEPPYFGHDRTHVPRRNLFGEQRFAEGGCVVSLRAVQEFVQFSSPGRQVGEAPADLSRYPKR